MRKKKERKTVGIEKVKGANQTMAIQQVNKPLYKQYKQDKEKWKEKKKER